MAALAPHLDAMEKAMPHDGPVEVRERPALAVALALALPLALVPLVASGCPRVLTSDRPMRRRPRTKTLRQVARTGVGRAWALLVAVGLVVAQLAGLAHFVVVRHALCEHGGFVHDEATQGDHAAGDAKPGAAASFSSREASAADADRDRGAAPGGADHDHCDALVLRHRVDADVEPHVPVATLLERVPAPSCGPAAARPPVAALGLAPKASPPTT